MTKEEVLSKLSELGNKRASLQEQWTELNNGAKEKAQERDTIKKAYDEIKARFEEAEALFQAAKTDLSTCEKEGTQVKDEIESLQRELSRILDAEKIHADYLAQIEELRNASLSATWRKENRGDGFGAYEYQIDGAFHLATAKCALLGDKRGLGKSLTSLIFADLIDSHKCIIICPSGSQNNFIREINLWTPHRTPIKIGQMPKAQRQYLLGALVHAPTWTIILNYEAWRRDETLIDDLIVLKADTLIVDEAHNAKEMKSIIAQGIKRLRFGCNECPGCGYARCSVEDDTPWVAKCKCGLEANIREFNSVKNYLPMTGSFILNKPQELFPHLHLIDPKLFPDEKTYLRDFCIQGADRKWRFRHGGSEALLKKIGPRYLARDRQSAGVIIPPNAVVEHVISTEEFAGKYPKQYAAYEQARKYAQIVLDPDNQKVMSISIFLTLLMRLRQVLVWPNAIELHVTNPETKEKELYGKLEVYESCKLDYATKLIKEINEEADRVALMSQFKPGLHELQRRLGYRTAVYDGSTSRHMKDVIELDFDRRTMPKHPKYDNVLANYKSGGVALNFTGAAHMVLLDREWNPAKEDQAIGRIDRLGQTQDTETHIITVENTVDSWMAKLIDAKGQLVEGFEDNAKLFQAAWDALRSGEM